MTSFTTTQTVADKLRTDVVSGHFPPNMRLIEAQLTERYETGRASVRSAIVELVKEGLLTREVNRGATVRMIEQTEMIEIYEARTMIEVLLGRRAAEHATQDERAHLRVLLNDMIDAAKESSPARFADSGHRLNTLIGKIGRHRVANDLIQVLRNQSRQIPAPFSAYAEKRVEFAAEAVAIIEAIIQGDVEGTERLVRTHYESIISVLR